MSPIYPIIKKSIRLLKLLKQLVRSTLQENRIDLNTGMKDVIDKINKSSIPRLQIRQAQPIHSCRLGNQDEIEAQTAIAILVILCLLDLLQTGNDVAVGWMSEIRNIPL